MFRTKVKPENRFRQKYFPCCSDSKSSEVFIEKAISFSVRSERFERPAPWFEGLKYDININQNFTSVRHT
jgi:hypothetical protein